MKKLIEQFIEKLNKDGVLSEEQITEFETLGVEFQKYVTEAEKKAEKSAKEEKDEEIEEIEETFKRILNKIDEIKKVEIAHELCKYREHVELSFNESDVVESISTYLDGVIEEHLPEQAIVDYAKLDRLEKTMETLRESLIISSDEVQNKVNSVLEDIQEELSQKSTLLNDAIERNITYKNELNVIHTEKLLEEKVADLPEFEQKKLRKTFKESTIDEINTEFDGALEQIQKEELSEEIEKVEVSAVREETQEFDTITDVDRYAQLAERWLPKNKK